MVIIVVDIKFMSLRGFGGIGYFCLVWIRIVKIFLRIVMSGVYVRECKGLVILFS